MANETIEQAITQIRAAKRVLVLVGSNAGVDVLASALAMKEYLVKFEKQVRVLSVTPVEPKLKLLQDAALEQSGALSKNLVIEVSLTKAQLSELNYQKQDDKLSIFLVPKSGEFSTTDVNVKTNIYPFDLIITLGVANLEELGNLQANHAQLFFETPIVNIDYKPSNEGFGQINIQSLTSAGVSEIVFDLLMEFDANFFDEKIATLLLAGLVSVTNSFQSQKTTPQVFNKASKLVSLGAKQQEIITQLYRSKSLGLLRLWGRVLARLKYDTEKQIVSSTITRSDIEKSEVVLSEVDQVIDEMIEQLPFGKVFLVVVEGDNSATVLAASTNLTLDQMFGTYNPSLLSPNVIKFTVGKPLTETETEVIETVRKVL